MQNNRIRVARDVAGLTQLELAESIDTTQPGVASLESGRYQASAELLRKIATATGFHPSFFERGALPELSAGSLLFRTQSSVKQSAKAQAHAYCLVALELAETLSKRLKAIPVNIPKLNEDSISTSAQIARSSLGISPNSPIKNPVGILEKNGVFVFSLPISIEGLDGFSSWAGERSSRPVIALLGGKTGYRPVFTAAEELAHLVLHQPLSVTVAEADKQARAFAQEFLLPEEAMRLEMTNPITLSVLADMKPRWGASIQFLAKRAETLGFITSNQLRYLMQQVTAQGWRKHEPGDESVILESPRLLRTMAEILYGKPINIPKLASDSGLSGKMLREQLGVEDSESRILEFKPRANVPLASSVPPAKAR